MGKKIFMDKKTVHRQIIFEAEEMNYILSGLKCGIVSAAIWTLI